MYNKGLGSSTNVKLCLFFFLLLLAIFSFFGSFALFWFCLFVFVMNKIMEETGDKRR